MQRQGLGEAISFTTTSGQHILVDAGERGSALRGKLRQPAGAGEWGSALRRKLRERVDVLLLTHNDSDHVGGAPDLLRSGLIREVWLPYDWHLLYSAGTNLVDALQNGDSESPAQSRRCATTLRADSATTYLTIHPPCSVAVSASSTNPSPR